jgi:hypothetical protein
MERQRDGWTGDNCDTDDDMQHGPVGDEDGELVGGLGGDGEDAGDGTEACGARLGQLGRACRPLDGGARGELQPWSTPSRRILMAKKSAVRWGNDLGRRRWCRVEWRSHRWCMRRLGRAGELADDDLEGDSRDVARTEPRRAPGKKMGALGLTD